MQAHVGDLTMSPHVRVIGDDANVSDLQKELEHKDRWWNTIVVSECKNPNRGIDIDALQRNFLGCANIYFLPEAHEFDFVEAVGDEHRVYGGAARSFRPRFRAGETQSTANPVIRAPWKTNDFFSERALHILSLDAFETSTRRIALNRDAPGFADARQFVAQPPSPTAPNPPPPSPPSAAPGPSRPLSHPPSPRPSRAASTPPGSPA
jgi:hypothetical protein